MTDNQRGALLMVIGMAGFAAEDAFLKLAATTLPTGQVLMTVGLGGALLTWAWLAREGRSLAHRAFWHPAVLGRNVCEMIGTFGFILAITLTDLSKAAAIFQAMPLYVTAGAALFLGEQVGWRRWLAILVGFAGVLLIVRPGSANLDSGALWALLAVVGLGSRDLFTRRIPPVTDSTMLVGWGFGVVAAVGAVWLGVEGRAMAPDVRNWAYLLGAIAVGIAGYWALTESTRTGELSAVMPFRYSRLVFAMILGALIFGERPDRWVWIGSALIIGSGLYAFARERARARLSRPGASV